MAAADEMIFDGNLVGNLGEACAVEEYGMKLVKARSNVGFDGYTPDCGMMSPIDPGCVKTQKSKRDEE